MKRLAFYLFCFVGVSLGSGVQCQQSSSLSSLTVTVDAGDRSVYDRYQCEMQAEKQLSVGERMVKSALFFLETPYVGGTLEKEPEELVVNLREFDCSTLVENVLALSLTQQMGECSFDSFCRQLQKIRYRGEVIEDYTDRLHYMSDWIYENEQKGRVKDMTHELGGVAWPLHLSFVSTHPDSYKPLKNHPQRVKRMAQIEQQINARPHYYIPKQSIDSCSAGIQNGDIVCFVTSIKGLDVTHVGIAYWQKGELTFIHASSVAKKVVVQKGSLRAYTEQNKSCKGILVVRPLPPIRSLDYDSCCCLFGADCSGCVEVLFISHKNTISQ